MLSSTTWRRVESRIRIHVLPAIGHHKLSDLNHVDVARVTDRIKGAVLANRTLEDIRVVLGHVLTLGWIDKNVAAGIRKRRELPRERYLKREEVGVLFDVLPNIPSADLIRFLVLTGCRLNEARQMVWSDIHGDVWIKRAATTKARRTHSVPLLPSALAIIAQQKRRGSYVFSRSDGNPIGSVQKVWEAARRKAGFPDLRIHDLRHTIASLALQGGVPLSVVSKMLGHSTPAITHRYAHLELDHLRDGFEKALTVKETSP